MTSAIDLIKKSLLSFGVKIGGTGCTFLVNVLIARELGAADAGVYFLALTVVTIAVAVSRYGMDYTLTRYLSTSFEGGAYRAVRSLSKYAFIVTTLLAMGLCLGILLMAPFVAGPVFETPDLTDPLKVMAISIPGMTLVWLVAGALRGLHRVVGAQAVESFSVPSLLLVLMFVLLPTHALDGAVWAYVIATGVAGVFSFGYLLYHLQKLPEEGDEPDLPKFKGTARELFYAEVTQVMLLWLPTIALGIYATSTEVGLFQAASRVGMLLSFFVMAARGVASSKIATMVAAGEHAALQSILQKTTLAAAAVMLPPSLVFIFAPEFVMQIFGEEYIQASQVLAIVTFGQVYMLFMLYSNTILTMSGHEKLFKRIILSALVVGVIANLTLTRYYGLEGAAFSMIVVTIWIQTLSTFFVKRKLDIVCYFPAILFKQGKVK